MTATFQMLTKKSCQVRENGQVFNLQFERHEIIVSVDLEFIGTIGRRTKKMDPLYESRRPLLERAALFIEACEDMRR